MFADQVKDAIYLTSDVWKSIFDTITVQAPQPPSEQPSFVPVNLTAKLAGQGME